MSLKIEMCKEIDAKLFASDWVAQDKNRMNLPESFGVTVQEFLYEGNASCIKTINKNGDFRIFMNEVQFFKKLIELSLTLEENKMDFLQKEQLGIVA